MQDGLFEVACSTDGKLTRGHLGRILLASRQRRLHGLRVQRGLHGPEWRAVHGVSGGQVQDGVGSRIVQQLPLGYKLETFARHIGCDCTSARFVWLNHLLDGRLALAGG